MFCLLPRYRSLTGCDNTWHIPRKRTKHIFQDISISWPFHYFSLSQLGNDSNPSADVFKGCISLLCHLTNSNTMTAPTVCVLRWTLFTTMPSNQDMDNVPPTYNHMIRPHLLALRWPQDNFAAYDTRSMQICFVS